MSDLDGKFTLQVPSPKSVLVISYVGYETYEVIVGNKTSFNIVLGRSDECTWTKLW
ncbi:carboxypeptidase-like regulatory domain-containing protein [Bacteroides salyersiae]|nr:carboxypeptidase-like regulatory domain-containing protein [Bacteroides salyersiae]